MDNDEPKDATGESNGEERAAILSKLTDQLRTRSKPKSKSKPKAEGKAPGTGKGTGTKLFQPGNKLGKKFGQGQPTNLGGAIKGAKTIMGEVKASMDMLGLSVGDVTAELLKIAMDDTIEARYRYPFMRDVLTRVLGQPKSSLEESIKVLERRMDKLYDLNMQVLEATSINDGVALVRELVRQGKLEKVVESIREEHEEVS